MHVSRGALARAALVVTCGLLGCQAEISSIGAPDGFVIDGRASDVAAADGGGGERDAGGDAGPPACVPTAEQCNGVDDDCDGTVDEGCACSSGESRPCGSDVGQCAQGTQGCSDGKWGDCTGAVGPVDETCNNLDDDCSGKIDDGLSRPCGTNTGVCNQGTQSCAAGKWGACSDVKPSAEVCDGKDNDCDGKVDDGLAQDKGTFAGCANYRALISKAISIFDSDQATGNLGYRWTSSAREDGGDQAAHGLLARTELLLSTKGVPLDAGVRQAIFDQAIEQADGFALWDVGGAKAKAVRTAAGVTHSWRGWWGGSANPMVVQYYTGPILLGLELLSWAIYQEGSLGASYAAKADGYHARVGQVIDHWIDTNGSHFKSKSSAIAGITKENWVCMEEPSASCTLDSGARAVKWNKTAFFWRAVGVWNDVDNQYQSSTTTYRRIRTVRYVRWMKEDMLVTSAPWGDTKPYVWHSWADAPSSYPYIEDASHGAWDAGLMAEAWRGGWKDEGGGAVMGPGSATRFRHTYMDNLAIPGDPCVGMFTDGSQQIPGHKYEGLELIPGRRRALTEWIPMANKDVAYLEELYEDLTGVCDGNNPLASTRHMALGYARFVAEIRKIRGE